NASASSMCVSPSRFFPARPWWWRCGRTAAPFPGAPRSRSGQGPWCSTTVFASWPDCKMEEGDPIEAAEALIASGKAEDGARNLRGRLEGGRGGLLARLTMVKALSASGDTQAALAEAREAAALNPDAAPAILGLGKALLAADALPAAIAELQRALRLDP